ncbi:MAG TPA: hypothetical protein VGI10_18390, partial [Polyangiaceae bacterium]
MRVRFRWISLVLLAACGRHQATSASSARAEPSACRYDVTIRSEEPLLLEVEARCAGRVTGFSAGDERARPFITVPGERTSARNSDAFPVEQTPNGGFLNYRVDLDAAARDSQRFDVAKRVGRSLIAPASSFLLVPEPVDIGIPIAVAVHSPHEGHFSAGLLRGADSLYHLQAHEVSVATYCVFGSFASETLALGSSTLEVATLDGPLATSAAERRRWIEEDARAVADFYGVFPAPHALIAVIPLPHHEAVDFGKLLPASGPGVALVVGSGAKHAALYDDWILVHELFHIGFPSFFDEGKWLDEGSATYFEPIIRARVGQLSEREVWRQFVTQMPQGFDAITHTGLEYASSRGIYWGGALACLWVDVEARRTSNNQHTLESAFRAVLAEGGMASNVWSLARVVAAIDRTLGAPILTSFVKEHAFSGSPLDTEALWRDLGVRREGDQVSLDD